MAIRLGIKLLVYGEDVNYVYGGKYDNEKASAKEIMLNDVVKPIWKEWFEDGQLSEKDLESARMPTNEEIEPED